MTVHRSTNAAGIEVVTCAECPAFATLEGDDARRKTDAAVFTARHERRHKNEPRRKR